MTEEEAKYIWKNRKGKVIFTPVYEVYKETFFDAIIEESAITSTFLKFESTAVYERYMLNSAQFAAAKQAAENELLKKAAEIIDPEGNGRSYEKYKPIAENICARSKDTWLRVEYDTARNNAVSGAQFKRMQDDSEFYPIWRYKGAMDSRERPEHVEMEGIVFKIGDPAGDACFPPLDWNCRCVGIQEDARYLQQTGAQVQSNEQATALMEKNVAPEFRFNAANQGNLPKENHSYFEALGNANDANRSTFGLPPAKDEKGDDLIGLRAIGMHFMANEVDRWRQKYHSKTNGDLVFQNKRLFANVTWNSNSFHAVGKHQRGFENIPEVIANPDEVWGLWEDVDKQLVSLRTYIKFGRSSYLVFTKDGIIKDAYALSGNSTDKYRKGLLL